MDNFYGPMHILQHCRNEDIELRNCPNKWQCDDNVNEFIAISEPDLLGNGEWHHGFMAHNKSCLLTNKSVYEFRFV